MSEGATSLSCSEYGTVVNATDAIRRETYGDLDRKKWQMICCPDCGARIKTVFVPRFERDG